MGMTFAPLTAGRDGLLIRVNEQDGVITLTSRQRLDRAGRECIWQALRHASCHGRKVWTIRALNAGALGGVQEVWCDGVARFLSDRTLVYEPSQLERTLRFSRGYRHQHSVFPPEGT